MIYYWIAIALTEMTQVTQHRWPLRKIETDGSSMHCTRRSQHEQHLYIEDTPVTELKEVSAKCMELLKMMIPGTNALQEGSKSLVENNVAYDTLSAATGYFSIQLLHKVANFEAATANCNAK